jgi:hypothetical protein
VGGEPGGTSDSIHGLGYLFSALSREGLIADELVLQLATFLRSLDLFLELIVLAPRTLTANQVRHGGKQGGVSLILGACGPTSCIARRSADGSIVRYADDLIIRFEHEKVAQRFWEVVLGSRHIRSGLPP